RWSGGSRFLGYALCQAMRRVLVGEFEDPAWSQRARETLRTLRAEHAFLHDEPAPILDSGDHLEWWTFAGGGANLLLARMLEAELGEKVTSGNTSVRFKEKAGESVVAVREVIASIAERQGPTAADAARFAIGASKGRLSKFDRCLPEELLGRLIVEGVLDVEGARAVVLHEAER
ncbi:MAG TPA: ATP-dependent helicase, partial [Polyangiaceae bacterium]|nr:ATP-dependent helicase [Polyangiaceae bacterium]